LAGALIGKSQYRARLSRAFLLFLPTARRLRVDFSIKSDRSHHAVQASLFALAMQAIRTLRSLWRAWRSAGVS
jgi:hypothetical protein